MTCAGEGASGRRLSGNSILEKRQKAVEHFWKTGELQPQSNVQFGEGGAGAVSDGKLNTGPKGRGARGVVTGNGGAAAAAVCGRIEDPRKVFEM